MATAVLPSISSSFLRPLKPDNPAKLSKLSFSRKTSAITSHSLADPRPKPSKSPNGRPQRSYSSRRRPKYGTSRTSILKKSFTHEQVIFTGPVSDDPHVGIIGGGMAGLVCALTLDSRGVRSTVFDTGIHGLGGRMGTRVVDPQQLIFDHAAQFFTVNDSRFAQLVSVWLEKGLIRQWTGVVGELQLGGKFTAFPSTPPRYVSVNGMRPFADSLLSQTRLVDVVRPCWISKLEPFNRLWRLSQKGKLQGQFDVIVIAHNGKCANRLLSSSGLSLIARQMKRLELSSRWPLLAAFDEPLPMAGVEVEFEGAFVKGVETLSWMGNNSTKIANFQSNAHCWTFFSTAAYGRQNKVPQENIPTATAEKVKAGMLEGVEAALGLPKGSIPKPFYTRLQLWGAALPMNSPGIPCIFDPHGRAGICGDWLLGSSLESAALSGMSLANHIADFLQDCIDHPDKFAAGLEKEFQPLAAQDIGQFPGLTSQGEKSQVEAYQFA